MLIPDEIDVSCSTGEKLVFYKFRNDSRTDSYYVLHSLFISRHLKNVSGEADFLVLVPGHGIFCLEVKHGRVSRDGGNWIFENKLGLKTNSAKGPFRQVSDTMHSLRNWLLDASAMKPDLHNRLKKLLTGWGVIFTSLEYFSDYGSEAESWQICTNQLKYVRISDFITSLSRGWHDKFAGLGWHNDATSRPTIRDCEDILRLLRGDFSYDYRTINQITDQETLIEEFTREQFDVLDFADYNQRCLIEGTAGSGKTILAEELFSRQIRAGSRTALLCYNNLLGQRIAGNIRKMFPASATPYYAGTLHAYMVRFTGVQAQETHEFYAETLPLEFLMKADDLPDDGKFDYLIIDEAQDLLTANYLDVLDAMLKGGLAGGAWCCFGDFTDQAIYINNPDAARESLSRRATFARHPPLRINCRNSRRIADQNTLLTGSAKARLNSSLPEGEPVEPFFVSQADIAGQVEQIIRDLTGRKVPLFRIAVLSAHRWDGSHLESPYITQKISEGLAFHTVHAFKGLENSVIILTGFSRLSDEVFQRLMYVGISRARVKLYIVLEQNQKAVYEKLIATNYTLLNP